jgi:hypothetical protein
MWLCSAAQHQILYIVVPWVILSIYFAKVDDWSNVFSARGEEQVGSVNEVWYSFFQSIGKLRMTFTCIAN